MRNTRALPTSLPEKRPYRWHSLAALATASAFLCACKDTYGPESPDTAAVYDSDWKISLVAEGSPAYRLVVKNEALYSLSWGDSALRKHSLSTGGVKSLVTAVPPPQGAVSDGDHVYWLSGGSVYRTSIDGSFTTLVAPGENHSGWAISSLAIDETHVYFVNARGIHCGYTGCLEHIRRVPKAGGAATDLAMTSHISGIAVADGHVFWVSSVWIRELEWSAAIYKVPVAGGTKTEVVNEHLNGLIPPSESGGWYPMGGLEVSGSMIYFAAQSGPAYRMLRVSASGGSVTVLAELPSTAGSNAVRDIELDENSVYWLDRVAVRTVSKSGGPHALLASSLSSPTSLEHAGASLFWVENTCNVEEAKGSIRSVATSGGTPVTIKEQIDCPVGVSADATHLFWLESGVAGFARIGRMNHDGAGATVLIEAVGGGWSTGYGGRFDVDATHVYFAEGRTIKRVPEDGGPAQRVGIATSYPSDIATDGVHVYWSGIEYKTGGPFATVQRAPVGGGLVTTVGSSMERGISIGANVAPAIIRMNATHVYWSAAEKFILGAPKAGGATTVVIGPMTGGLTDFVLADGNVYVAELIGGRLLSFALGGSEPAPLAQLTPDRMRRLATDGTHLYWIDQNTVGRIGVSGGPPEYIFRGSFPTNYATANEIDIAATGLYWTDWGRGRITRAVPK